MNARLRSAAPPRKEARMKGKGKFWAMVWMSLGLVFLAGCAATIISDTVSASTIINAPPEKVFAYVADPKTELEWDPAMKGISNLEGSGLGFSERWQYNLSGQVLEGKRWTVDYVPNQRIVNKNSGDWGYTTNTWLFVPDPQGTKLMLVWEGYLRSFPSELQKISNEAFQASWQEGCDAVLKRIKAAVEKQ